MARILLVEDDVELAFMVEKALQSKQHVVESVTSGDDGLAHILNSYYDLAVLDWELPGVSGLEICQQYRKMGGNMPILFLTGKTAINDRVSALDTGADDYICKPFTRSEFLARIDAILRRPPQQMTEKTIRVGHVELELEKSSISISGNAVELSRSEFALLSLFLQNPERIFSHNDIVEKVFKNDSETTKKSVRQLVARIRQKVDIDGRPSIIETIKNLGYRLKKAD